MTAFRVIQISDTHLSGDRAYFTANFAALPAILAAEAPDLLINTGDVTLDGADRDSDLAYARVLHDRLAVPWLAIPGNHDLGDNPAAQPSPQPVNPARLARWERHFGPDRFYRRIGPWSLIGINAQLFGSGLAAEDAQWDWLDAVIEHAGGGPIALFVHKPLFVHHAEDDSLDILSVPPASRARLGTALAHGDVHLIASGHLHAHAIRRHGRVAHVWGPSSAFFVGNSVHDVPAVRRLGYVRHDFTEAGVTSTVIESDAFEPIDADALKARLGITALRDAPVLVAS